MAADRQDPAVHSRLGIGRRAAVAVGGPSLGDRLSGLMSMTQLAEGDDALRDVEQKGRDVAARRGKGEGVVAMGKPAAAPRSPGRHTGTATGWQRVGANG